MIGFLFNRIVSNVGFLLAGIYALIKLKEIFWLFKDHWMWTFIGLAILPLLSDIYYEGIYFYNERGIMKMVLVLFPAFIFVFKPHKKYITAVNLLVIILMLISSGYTLGHYFTNSTTILDAYKISKVMPTLSYGDHIRISWVVVMSMVLAIYEMRGTNSNWLKISLLFYCLIQYFFLHILGSKTGLISLYVTIALMSYFLIPRGKKWWLFFLFFVFAIGAYFTVTKIPSLRERVNFVKYDFEHYSKGEYREGLSDAIRFYSLKAGKDIISDYPLFGVGFSKLQDSTNHWYQNKMPQIPKENYFLPSSEIVIYWASGGIVGLLVFLGHLILPLFRTYQRQSVWFLSFFIPAAMSFCYETHLEGQLALFVYSFFAAWFWYLAYSDNQHKELG